MNNQKPFAALMLPYRNVYDLSPLFGDFLDPCLCVLTPNAVAGLPWDRERFERILDKYSAPAYTFDFVALFSCLLHEIPKCSHCYEYNDVLGDFYEEHILGYDPENIFCSWDLDEHILRSNPLIRIPACDRSALRKAKLLDELCGSGRRLLEKRWLHSVDGFYGVEVTPVCAKMTILNLFLNKVPSAEVVCKKVDDYSYGFQSGYFFSAASLGIEEITRPEDSALWQVLEERQGLLLVA